MSIIRRMTPSVTRWSRIYSSSPVRLSNAISLTGLQGPCPFPCVPPMALFTWRLPSLVRVPASPVPRCHRYYEGATTSHSRISGRLLVSLPLPTRSLLLCVRRGAPGGVEVPSRPGPWVPAARISGCFVWTPMGSLRSSGDPSCAFAPLQDPGRTDVASPLTATSMLPPLDGRRRLRRCLISGLIRSFSTY